MSALLLHRESLSGLRLNDRYLLQELIGVGACGHVYAATQLSLDRRVAVKVLRREWSHDDALMERFHDEALVGGKISHPNIVSIIDYGGSGGYLYIVMEYLRGRSLGDIVRKGPPLELDRAVDLFSQAMRGLTAAHNANIIHADIKPDNVVVLQQQREETAKLVDFGLAKFIRRYEHPHAIESRHKVSGTPDYIAPEVVLGHGHTVSADVYSSGALLYELLTGMTPFGSGEILDVLERHVRCEVIAPSTRRPDGAISPELDQVVMRALAKDPSHRHLSADALRRAVERACHPVIVEVRPPVVRPVESPMDSHRHSIGEAIAAGDAERICARYLAFADALSRDGKHGAAAAELSEAVDVVTGGEGPGIGDGPASLWRVLIALARSYMRVRRTERARSIALHAWRHAALAHSRDGQEAAQALLRAMSPIMARSARARPRHQTSGRERRRQRDDCNGPRRIVSG